MQREHDERASISATNVKNDKIRFDSHRQFDKAVISTRILYKKRIIRKGFGQVAS